jgi:hypothetical protein
MSKLKERIERFYGNGQQEYSKKERMEWKEGEGILEDVVYKFWDRFRVLKMYEHPEDDFPMIFEKPLPYGIDYHYYGINPKSKVHWIYNPKDKVLEVYFKWW